MVLRLDPHIHTTCFSTTGFSPSILCPNGYLDSVPTTVPLRTSTVCCSSYASFALQFLQWGGVVAPILHSFHFWMHHSARFLLWTSVLDVYMCGALLTPFSVFFRVCGLMLLVLGFGSNVDQVMIPVQSLKTSDSGLTQALILTSPTCGHPTSIAEGSPVLSPRLTTYTLRFNVDINGHQ